MSRCHWWSIDCGQAAVLRPAEATPLATGLPPSSSEGAPPSPRWTRAYCLLLPPKRRLDTQSLEKGLTSEGPEAYPSSSQGHSALPHSSSTSFTLESTSLKGKDIKHTDFRFLPVNSVQNLRQGPDCIFNNCLR